MTNEDNNHEPEGFIVNIDTASEEIQRLENRLAARENRLAIKRDFMPNLDEANAEVKRLETLLASAPAAPVVAPAKAEPERRELTASGQPLTGLARLIDHGQGRNASAPTAKPKLTGLARAQAANRNLQPSK